MFDKTQMTKIISIELRKIFLKTRNFGMNYMKYVDDTLNHKFRITVLITVSWKFKLGSSNLQHILSTPHIVNTA